MSLEINDQLRELLKSTMVDAFQENRQIFASLIAETLDLKQVVSQVKTLQKNEALREYGGMRHDIDLIYLAIKERKMIQFDYKGKERLAEPHMLGIHKNTKKTNLRAWFLSGYSESGTQDDNRWRIYSVENMENMRISETGFDGIRMGFNPVDPFMSRTICTISHSGISIVQTDYQQAISDILELGKQIGFHFGEVSRYHTIVEGVLVRFDRGNELRLSREIIEDWRNGILDIELLRERFYLI